MSATVGWPTKTGWKRRSSAASFSMCLRYSSRVVAPTARSSPRASIGLSMFAASTAPSAAPAPTIVCSSSMKRTISPAAFWISPRTAFSRSSNSPRYFAPASSAPMSSAHTRLPFSPSGTSPATMRCASPSTMAVFPTPGSPIRTGLFFVLRERTWITRRISSSRPMTGSSLPASARAVRSRPYFSSAWYVPSGSCDVTFCPPRTSWRAASSASRGTTSRARSRCSTDANSSPSSRMVSKARSRARAERGRGLRLRVAPGDRGLAAEARLGLGPQVGGTVAGPVDERARQLLVEEREQEVVGRQLRVAHAARELLRAGDGLLRLQRQLLERPRQLLGHRGCCDGR